MVRALNEVLDTFHREGSTRSVLDRIGGFDQYNAAIGLAKWFDLGKQHDG